MSLFDDLTVGFADFLIPEEGILAAAGEIAASVIMLIDIDESVSLGVLACTCGHKVDRTPCRVADQVDAVFDSFFHGLDMLSEVGDPVLIVDGAILLDLIKCAEAVLDGPSRKL